MPIFGSKIQQNNPNVHLIDVQDNLIRGFGIFNTIGDRNNVAYDPEADEETSRCKGYLAVMKDTDTALVYKGDDLAANADILSDANWENTDNWVEISSGDTIGATGPQGDPGSGTLCGIALPWDVINIANLGAPGADGRWFFLDSNGDPTLSASDAVKLVWEPSADYHDLLTPITSQNYNDFTLAFYGEMEDVSGVDAGKSYVTSFRVNGQAQAIVAGDLQYWYEVPVSARGYDATYSHFIPNVEIAMCVTFNGDPGPTGATGSSGVKGDAGDTGPSGDPGDTGATGPKGELGLTGGCNQSFYDEDIAVSVGIASANASGYNRFNVLDGGSFATNMSDVDELVFNQEQNDFYNNIAGYPPEQLIGSILKITGVYVDGTGQQQTPEVMVMAKYKITGGLVTKATGGATNGYSSIQVEYISPNTPATYNNFFNNYKYTLCVEIPGAEGETGATGEQGDTGPQGATGFTGGCVGTIYEGQSLIADNQIDGNGFAIAVISNSSEGDDPTAWDVDSFQIHTVESGNNTTQSLFAFQNANGEDLNVSRAIIYPVGGYVDQVNSIVGATNWMNSAITISGQYDSVSTTGQSSSVSYTVGYQVSGPPRVWPGTPAGGVEWRFMPIKNPTGGDPNGVYVYPSDQQAGDPNPYYTYCLTSGGKGDAGDTGPIGLTGDDGQSGATGATGGQGETGPQGLQGTPSYCVDTRIDLFLGGSKGPDEINNIEYINFFNFDNGATPKFTQAETMDSDGLRLLIHPDSELWELMGQFSDADWARGGNISIRGTFDDAFYSASATAVWSLGINSKPSLASGFTGSDDEVNGFYVAVIDTAYSQENVYQNTWNTIPEAAGADEYRVCFQLRGVQGDTGASGPEGPKGDPGANAGAADTFFDADNLGGGVVSGNVFNLFTSTAVSQYSTTRDATAALYIGASSDSELADALLGMSDVPGSNGYWGRSTITISGVAAETDGGTPDTSVNRFFRFEPTGYFYSDGTLNQDDDWVVLPIEYIGATTPDMRFLNDGSSYRITIQYSGDAGDTGSQGATGPKGDTGDSGPNGGQGDTGSQGDTGAQGGQGATGESGLPGGCSLNRVDGTSFYSDTLFDNTADFAITDNGGNLVLDIGAARRLYFSGKAGIYDDIYDILTFNGEYVNLNLSVAGSFQRSGSASVLNQTHILRVVSNVVYSVGGIYYVEVYPERVSGDYVNIRDTRVYTLCTRPVGFTGATGPQGEQGSTGIQGDDGGKGDTGVPGEEATVFLTTKSRLTSVVNNLSSQTDTFVSASGAGQGTDPDLVDQNHDYDFGPSVRYIRMSADGALYNEVFKLINFSNPDARLYKSKAKLQISGTFGPSPGEKHTFIADIISETYYSSDDTYEYQIEVFSGSSEVADPNHAYMYVAGQNTSYVFSCSFVGEQGESGATGPTGATGARGDTGSIGLTGDDGESGATGATGPIGATGAQGDTGPLALGVGESEDPFSEIVNSILNAGENSFFFWTTDGSNGTGSYSSDPWTDGTERYLFFHENSRTNTVLSSYSQSDVTNEAVRLLLTATFTNGASTLGPSGVLLKATSLPTASEVASWKYVSFESFDTTPASYSGYGIDSSEPVSLNMTITGPVGPAGEAADRGDTGSTGVKGDAGDTGPIGLNGEQGSTGSTGVQGATGSKGDTGVQGATGSKGDTATPFLTTFRYSTTPDVSSSVSDYFNTSPLSSVLVVTSGDAPVDYERSSWSDIYTNDLSELGNVSFATPFQILFDTDTGLGGSRPMSLQYSEIKSANNDGFTPKATISGTFSTDSGDIDLAIDFDIESYGSSAYNASVGGFELSNAASGFLVLNPRFIEGNSYDFVLSNQFGKPGATGPGGERGYTGDTGPAGQPGATGLTGSTGPKGDNGDPGAHGLDGEDGDTGATGPIGATGARGDTGTIGLNGEQGSTGATGSQGATGLTGDIGATGVPGPSSTIVTGQYYNSGTLSAEANLSQGLSSTSQYDVPFGLDTNLDVSSFYPDGSILWSSNDADDVRYFIWGDWDNPMNQAMSVVTASNYGQCTVTIQGNFDNSGSEVGTVQIYNVRSGPSNRTISGRTHKFFEVAFADGAPTLDFVPGNEYTVGIIVAGTPGPASIGAPGSDFSTEDQLLTENRIVDQAGYNLKFDLKGGELAVGASGVDKTFIIGANGSSNVIEINGITYPTADGNAGQVIKTDGNGRLLFVDQTAPDATNVASALVSATSISAGDKTTIQTNLGVDPSGTDNSTDVTLSGAYNYLTLAGQQITLGQVDYTTDVSNTPTIPASGVDFDPVGTDNSTDVSLNASSTDVLRMNPGQILGSQDAGADKLVFWDDSEGKLTYATIGTNLTMTADTLSASGGGSGTITALNNQAENRLTTIGATTTELDGEANLTFDGTTLRVSGEVRADQVYVNARFPVSSSGGYFTEGARIGRGFFTSGSITAGALYVLGSTSWTLADADAASTGSGLLVVATDAESATEVVLEGAVNLGYSISGASKGDTLYLSTTGGEVTTTAPSATGDIVRIVGYVIDATNGYIYFKPDNTWLEL